MEKSESKIQSDIFFWYHNNYCLPHHSPRGLIMSVPNGGTRNIREAMTLKSTGLYPGASDLIVICNGQILFVEVKTPTGSQSVEQKRFESHVKQLFAQYKIVRSLEDFKELINYYSK